MCWQYVWGALKACHPTGTWLVWPVLVCSWTFWFSLVLACHLASCPREGVGLVVQPVFARITYLRKSWLEALVLLFESCVSMSLILVQRVGQGCLVCVCVCLLCREPVARAQVALSTKPGLRDEGVC